MNSVCVCVCLSSSGSSRGRWSSRNSHHAKSRRCVKSTVIHTFTHTFTCSCDQPNLIIFQSHWMMLSASHSPLVSAANVNARLLHCLRGLARRAETHTLQHFLPSPIQSDVILTLFLGSDIMAIFSGLWMFKEAQRASSWALAELHIDQLLYKRDYIRWNWPVGWVRRCICSFLFVCLDFFFFFLQKTELCLVCLLQIQRTRAKTYTRWWTPSALEATDPTWVLSLKLWTGFSKQNKTKNNNFP